VPDLEIQHEAGVGHGRIQHQVPDRQEIRTEDYAPDGVPATDAATYQNDARPM